MTPTTSSPLSDRAWFIGGVRIGGPLVLAPLAGYTSLPLRLLCRRAGADLVTSEMVSAQGLAHRSDRTALLLRTCPEEKPVAVQVFGGEPGIMAAAVDWVQEAGADILDINMGCPVPKIKRSEAGSALLADPDRAVAVAAAVVRRATIPVTCKIRAGCFCGDDSYLELGRRLQDVGVAAITVHGRTVSQGFKGEADHGLTARLVEALSIPVVASGDVFTPTMPRALLEDTGCAGVMIARGAIGRPWIFAQAKAVLEGREPMPDPPLPHRLSVALCQAQMMAQHSGEDIAVHEMRAHLAWYTKGMIGGSRVRRECNTVRTLAGLAELFCRQAHRDGDVIEAT